MTHHFSTKLASCILFTAVLFSGCSESEDGPEFVQVDPPSTVITGTDDDPGIEPFDLCTRTIEECGIEITLAQCESWYDDPANCADMDGYLACNADCLTEDTCDGYFACGEICFDDLCAE